MPGGSFTQRLPSDMGALAAVRHHLAEWLQRAGATPPAMDDWMLVVTELIANAVEASPAGSTIEVDAAREPGRIVLRVRNARGTEPSLPDALPADPLSERGRGLAIVRQLTDHLVFDITGGHTEATCWRGDPVARPT